MRAMTTRVCVKNETVDGCVDGLSDSARGWGSLSRAVGFSLSSRHVFLAEAHL